MHSQGRTSVHHVTNASRTTERIAGPSAHHISLFAIGDKCKPMWMKCLMRQDRPPLGWRSWAPCDLSSPSPNHLHSCSCASLPHCCATSTMPACRREQSYTPDVRKQCAPAVTALLSKLAVGGRSGRPIIRTSGAWNAPPFAPSHPRLAVPSSCLLPTITVSLRLCVTVWLLYFWHLRVTVLLCDFFIHCIFVSLC